MIGNYFPSGSLSSMVLGVGGRSKSNSQNKVPARVEPSKLSFPITEYMNRALTAGVPRKQTGPSASTTKLLAATEPDET